MVKLKSSSLAEVLIASLITSLSFVAASIIFIQATSGMQQTNKIRAEAFIQQDYNLSLAHHRYVNEELKKEEDGIIIEKTVSVPDYSNQFLILHYVAKDTDHHPIFQISYLIKTGKQ